MTDVYLIVGVPASGKSWLCDQLRNRFEYVPHDETIHLKDPEAYLETIHAMSFEALKPLLIEAPFSMGIEGELSALGYNVTPVFVIEEPSVLRHRYELRGRHEDHIIKGHLSRQDTFRKRAQLRQAFAGNSTEVLEHMRGIKKK